MARAGGPLAVVIKFVRVRRVRGCLHVARAGGPLAVVIKFVRVRRVRGCLHVARAGGRRGKVSIVEAVYLTDF